MSSVIVELGGGMVDSLNFLKDAYDTVCSNPIF